MSFSPLLSAAPAIAILERRAQTVRSRAAVRCWEYRQRRHAKGTWFRFRRVLADAERAFIVSEDAARELLAEGYACQSVGAELAPAKIIVFVPKDRSDRLADKREISVRLSAEMLAATCLVLVPWR